MSFLLAGRYHSSRLSSRSGLAAANFDFAVISENSRPWAIEPIAWHCLFDPMFGHLSRTPTWVLNITYGLHDVSCKVEYEWPLVL